MLHCIKQAPLKGGENQFADGLYCANLLKKRFPQLYRTLTSVPCDFANVGTDLYECHQHQSKPTIRYFEFIYI